MSSNSNESTEKVPVVKVIFKHEDNNSSEEPPMSEWSSLLFESPEENIKKLRYEEGLYSPGSGEICTKYVPLSASSVLRHPYFNYPGVTDPGIKEALLKPEPKVIYPDDGQELYLALCKESNLCPIRAFYRELLTDKIDLKYYGINPMAFRAIALSLKYNKFVTVLDLTDNWISEDGCFHLGEMLIENINLEELNLYGCRIGPEGAKRLFANLHLNRALRRLNLCRNKLGDLGVQFLAKAIFFGSDITELNLSYNELTAKSVFHLSEAFQTHNKLTHLNLSWNSIISGNIIYTLCRKLSENKGFQEINLSWNSLSGQRVGMGIDILMKCPKLRNIYLSNNKLESNAVKRIGKGLKKAVGLTTLDLSFNPLTPNDAKVLIAYLLDRKIKVRNILLDNVLVKPDFIDLLNDIMSLNYRKNSVITYGGVIPKFVAKSKDMREILLDRAEALCKKKRKDIALLILTIHKINGPSMDTKQFAKTIKSMGAPLDEDLLEGLNTVFLGEILDKSKTINLKDLVDYLSRKWPDRKLPPTPPPEPEPEAPPIKTDKKKK
ncbi:unnamed protein product [Colias eurytheme]|nr:unnamed protein product [Colias eurytheme]